MAFLLNGRVHNLIYGSYAPDAPPVFISDDEFKQRWYTPELYYYVVDESGLERIQPTVRDIRANILVSAGGKYVVTNHPIREGL